jgi:hypothetical protein
MNDLRAGDSGRRAQPAGKKRSRRRTLDGTTTTLQQQAERPSRAVLERPRVYAKPTQQRFFVCSRPCAGSPRQHL